jgi:dimeric dUTPase (all-alpha-NTP-PPase superfamily)
MSDDAGDWLDSIMTTQRGLQELLGHDIQTMTIQQRVEYFKLNILACTDELHEALAESTWKPWTTADPAIDDEAAGRELIDALHFLVNLFLVVGWDARRVHAAYHAKHVVNVQRQQDGYDGLRTKCANTACRRALDEPGQPFQGLYVRGKAWCNDGCYDTWVQDQVA